MFHGHLHYFQNPPLGGRPNTKPGDHGTPNAHNRWLFYFIMCEDPREQSFIEIAFGWGPGHIWLHATLEGPWPHYMILEVCCDQWSGRFLGIITGWDPSVCKSNRSHVDILRFSFIELECILYNPLKWLVIFLQSSTSTGSFVTNCWFSPIIGWDGLWPVSIGLSQFHGHGSWLTCEVALLWV